ncbi:MAG: RNA 2',3'-cyclic phosphodiesterase [Candidatus Thermoplasmatota archaeon]|nr:RNA 2',3'-cyclic phosphodiesterase [Candidatus Thermoplasmatota archaeon]
MPVHAIRESVRVFIAVDVEDRSSFELLLNNPFFSSRCVRRVRPANLHYTLAFIGEIEDFAIQSISDMLDSICRSHGSFDVTYSGLGIFGTTGRPRVLWSGVRDMGENAAIGSEIASSLARMKVGFDSRELKPHVTLARFSCVPDRESLQLLLSEYGGTEFAGELVRKISVKRSVPGKYGAEYETLHESFLGL